MVSTASQRGLPVGPIERPLVFGKERGAVTWAEYLVGCALLGGVAWYDWRTRQISEWVTGSLILSGIGWRLWHWGWRGVIPVAVLWAVIGGIGLIAYLLHPDTLGGGDLLLLLGLSAWLGWSRVGLDMVLGTLIVGPLLALGWVLIRRPPTGLRTTIPFGWTFALMWMVAALPLWTGGRVG